MLQQAPFERKCEAGPKERAATRQVDPFLVAPLRFEPKFFEVLFGGKHELHIVFPDIVRLTGSDGIVRVYRLEPGRGVP